MNEKEMAEFENDYSKQMYNIMDEIYKNNELPAEAKETAHDRVREYLLYVAEEAKAEHKKDIDIGTLLWQALAREQVLMYMLKPHLKAQEDNTIGTTDIDYLLGAMFIEKLETEEDKERCKQRIKNTMAGEFEGNVLMPEDMENAYNNIIGYLQELENGQRSAKGEHWRLLVRCEAFKCWAKNGMRREMLADPELSEQEKTELVKELEKEFNRM